MKKSRIVLAVALCGLGFGPVAAQQGGAGFRQTEFPSVPRAIQAAQAAGMALAIDFHGNFRFVTPAVADLLLAQGFRRDSRGVLIGYEPLAFLSGWVFLDEAPLLKSGSYAVTIKVEDRPDAVEEEDIPDDECDPQVSEDCDGGG